MKKRLIRACFFISVGHEHNHDHGIEPELEHEHEHDHDHDHDHDHEHEHLLAVLNSTVLALANHH